MTIQLQWLIFGGIGIGLFIFGLLAKNGGDTNSAKEGHTTPLVGSMVSKTMLHSGPEREEEAVAAAHASR